MNEEITNSVEIAAKIDENDVNKEASDVEANTGDRRRQGRVQFSLKITNIAESTTVSDFEALLKNIGPHKKRYLALNGKTGTCKGFGFVHFKSKEHADKVKESLNGTNFKESVLQVEFEAPKPKRPRNFRKRRNFSGADEQSGEEGAETTIKPRIRKRRTPKESNDGGDVAENGNENAKPKSRKRKRSAIFSVQINGLPKSMDEKKFEELVKEFGSTKKRFISKDRTTSECNGFGFVHYSSKANAEKAIEVLNGKEIDGSTLIVEWSKRDNKTSNKTKIYISNLRDSVQENDVEDLVKDLGPYDRMYLAKDKTTGLGKGYAFVDFKSHEDAAKAVEKLNGFMVGENQLKVDWARVKEKRHRKYFRSRRSESGKDDGKKKSEDQVDNDLKKLVENITI